MQRARCYLIGETAVVLELEPPVTLASQKRIWRLAQRLVDMPNVDFLTIKSVLFLVYQTISLHSKPLKIIKTQVFHLLIYSYMK